MRKYLSILIASLILFSCKKEEGCMDPSASNYNSEATVDNGSCSHFTITDLYIHFTQTADGNPLIMDSMMYINQEDESYSVQTVRYLISDITLHSDNGTDTILKEVHFVDRSLEQSLTLKIPVTGNKDYTTISFTMGLDSTKNFTDLFLNENFFPSFAWPEFLGGGYHYMQLEGDLNTVFNGYTTHTGGTNGTDFSFKKAFQIAINKGNETQDIYINMEITNWYKNPETFNITTNGIMGDLNSQIILQKNGIEDVFSVYTLAIEQ
ncbi:MAG: hypothetical protein P8M34_07080 [Saprospiraceae bacterium]|nr:hypothetical protein [Saprospiraceae bacterium]